MAYNTLSDLLTGIADSIRSKKGTTAKINAQNLPSEIDSITLATGNAGTGDVLSGKTFSNASGNGLTGTMVNNGAVSGSVGVGGSYIVPAGYHNGSGKVSGPTLDGNADTSSVLAGKTFYSNSGTKQTGVLPYIGQYAEVTTYGSGDWDTDDPYFAINQIPEGVYSAEGATTWAPEVRIRTRYLGNVTVDKVLSGYTFTAKDNVAGVGGMPNNGAISATIAPGGSYTIPWGYHNGGGKVYASNNTFKYIQGGFTTGASYSSTLDFGSACKNGYAIITTSCSGYNNASYREDRIQGSNDNSSWTNLAGGRSNPRDLDGSITYACSITGYRYVRFYHDESSTNHNVTGYLACGMV